MGMAIVLSLHQFSLQAAIDHNRPSMYSGHYTTSIKCFNKTFDCNDSKITEFEMINTQDSSTACVIISQYHGCWCPGDARSQDISSYDID